jgi:hypothetical protein
VLSDAATGNVVSVGVLALPPDLADAADMALEATSSWHKDTTAVECRVAPLGDATLRTSDGKDGSVPGKSIPNNLGMIIGLSVGVPLLVLALAGGVYWHNHHQGTIEIKGRTKTLKKAMRGRGHHVITSANSSDPAPPVPQDILSRSKDGHRVLEHLESAKNFRDHQNKHSRQGTMSFAMPNGRIHSVRVSSMRDQVLKVEPPRHPSTRNLGGGDLASRQGMTESQPLMSERSSSFSEGSRLAVSTPPAGTSPAGVQIEMGKMASV